MIGRVYKIEVNKDDFYIGSTTLDIRKRENTHNHRLRKKENKCKLYEECRKNNITEIICILLKEKEIADIKEIRLLEQEYITKLQPSLNSQIAYTGLTKNQYNKEYKKEYYKKNKEKYNQYNKNKKEYNKEYYEKNKENKKDYYENNKHKLLEKIKCDICNSIVSRTNITIHKKSLKCRKSVECFIQDE